MGLSVCLAAWSWWSLAALLASQVWRCDVSTDVSAAHMHALRPVLIAPWGSVCLGLLHLHIGCGALYAPHLCSLGPEWDRHIVKAC
jgi:hypothetical protein